MSHRQITEREGEDPKGRFWDQPAYSMPVKVVCARCNNEWMAELEAKAKELLYPMLHGRGRVLHRGGQLTLAAWALKTVLMAQYAWPPGERAFPADEYAYLIEHGRPSKRIRIWMSSYAGDTPATGQLYGLDVDVMENGRPIYAGVQQDRDRGHRDIYGAAISFGPVVFQVVGTRLTVLLEDLRLNHPIVFPLWPYEQGFAWSPRAGFDDEALVKFGEMIPDYFRGQVLQPPPGLARWR